MPRTKTAPDEPEQGHLPGMEQQRHPRIHPKATRYVKLRDARIAANAEEKEAKDELIDVMLSEGFEVYEYKGLRVDITNKKDVKVLTNQHGGIKADEGGAED